MKVDISTDTSANPHPKRPSREAAVLIVAIKKRIRKFEVRP
jgi:hypothetical protein